MTTDTLTKIAAPVTALAAIAKGGQTLYHALSDDPEIHVVLGNIATVVAIVGAAIALYYLRKRHIYVLKEVQRVTQIAEAAATAAKAAEAALKAIKDAGKEITT